MLPRSRSLQLHQLCAAQRPVCPHTFPKTSVGRSASSSSVSRITITNLGILPPIKRLEYLFRPTSTPNHCITPCDLRTYYVITTLSGWGIPARILHCCFPSLTYSTVAWRSGMSLSEVVLLCSLHPLPNLKMTACSITSLLLVSQLVLKLVAAGSLPFPVPRSPSSSGKVCSLTPLGCRKDDTPQILKAFEDCNNGGTVVFPEGKKFYIASRMNPVVSDVSIEWRGLWQVLMKTN